MPEIITADEVGEILEEVAKTHSVALITPDDDGEEYSFVNHTTDKVDAYLTKVAHEGLSVADIENMAKKASLIAEVL